MVNSPLLGLPPLTRCGGLGIPGGGICTVTRRPRLFCSPTVRPFSASFVPAPYQTVLLLSCRSSISSLLRMGSGVDVIESHTPSSTNAMDAFSSTGSSSGSPSQPHTWKMLDAELAVPARIRYSPSPLARIWRMLSPGASFPSVVFGMLHSSGAPNVAWVVVFGLPPNSEEKLVTGITSARERASGPSVGSSGARKVTTLRCSIRAGTRHPRS